MLGKRIITSLLVVTLVILITFCLPDWAFALLVSFFVGLTLHEYFLMLGRKGIFTYRAAGIALGVLMPFVAYLQHGPPRCAGAEPFFIVAACLFVFVAQFMRRDGSDALVSVASTILGLVYIAWFLSFFVRLKLEPRGGQLIMYLILVTKSSDIGAYFVGRAFGRHALIPRISPAKTVEGMLGGLLSSVVMSVACAFLVPGIPALQRVMLGGLLGIIGQTGDLAESLLKRDCRVKDAGDHLSGFGGIFDLIDSLLFAAPFFFFYARAFLR